jgi:hypothetical protein
MVNTTRVILGHAEASFPERIHVAPLISPTSFRPGSDLIRRCRLRTAYEIGEKLLSFGRVQLWGASPQFDFALGSCGRDGKRPRAHSGRVAASIMIRRRPLEIDSGLL